MGWSKRRCLPKQTEKVRQKASSRAGDQSLGRHREKTCSRRDAGEPREGAPGLPPRPGRDRCRLPLRRLGGPRVPAAARPGPLLSALYLGLPAARGRNRGSVSGRPAPGSRGCMAPGRGAPLVFLAAPTGLRADRGS